jgi:hypothetical protein
LPSWQQLLDAIASEVDAYNNTHEHRELPKRNGRHMTLLPIVGPFSKLKVTILNI